MKVKVVDSTLVNKSSISEVAKSYAELNQASNVADEHLSALKPTVIELINKEGTQISVTTKEYKEDGFQVRVETKTLSKVDTEELARICKKKNVSIGTESLQVIPKNKVIPQDVLDSLDEYFVLNRVLDASVADVDNAVSVGLITKADRGKIVQEKPSFAVKVKTEDGFFTPEP
jgi:hypothetical protein